jgi:hypothetical protein
MGVSSSSHIDSLLPVSNGVRLRALAAILISCHAGCRESLADADL